MNASLENLVFVRDKGPVCYPSRLLWPPARIEETVTHLLASSFQWFWNADLGQHEESSASFRVLTAVSASEFISVAQARDVDDRSIFLLGVEKRAGTSELSLSQFKEWMDSFLKSGEGPVKIAVEQVGDMSVDYVFVDPSPDADVVDLMKTLGIKAAMRKRVPYRRLRNVMLERIVERIAG